MITNTQLSMIEQASPGINWPGITTLAGSQTTITTALKSWSTLPTTGTSPVFYDASHHRVIVQAAGTVLDGYDFRGVMITVNASNVTINNSTFDDATGYWAIREATGYNGLTVDHSTFAGTKVDHVYGDFISTGLGTATITNNTFLNAPSDAVHIVSGPGVISNVSVHDNVLVGGTVTVAAIESTAGTLSNVSIDNNYIGFGKLGAFYSGDAPQVEVSGNTIVDFSNLSGNAQAWQAFLAAGIHTDRLIVEGSTVTNLQSAGTGTTTLYAGAENGVHLFGGAHETIFVSGAGAQYLSGGSGKNIYTYLSAGDSTTIHRDLIGNFHDNQDVFDLHLISGSQPLKFIGSNAFDGGVGELHVVYNATTGITSVEADLDGDKRPDLHIEISGGVHNLTRSNFWLTAGDVNYQAGENDATLSSQAWI